MTNFNENAIREAAYYIWKNNGCPTNTSLQDWNAAINQLNNMASLSSKGKTTKKTSSCAAKISSATKKSSTTKKMPQIVLTSKKKSK